MIWWFNGSVSGHRHHLDRFFIEIFIATVKLFHSALSCWLSSTLSSFECFFFRWLATLKMLCWFLCWSAAAYLFSITYFRYFKIPQAAAEITSNSTWWRCFPPAVNRQLSHTIHEGVNEISRIFMPFALSLSLRSLSCLNIPSSACFFTLVLQANWELFEKCE